MKKALKLVISIITIAVVALLALFALGIVGSEKTNVHIDKYDGLVFSGEMEEGRFNGYGEIYFDNGDKYEGSFVDGRFDGEGTLYDSSELPIFHGVFSQGQIQYGTFYINNDDSIMLLLGEWEDTLIGNGWRYEGRWSESGQNGQGCFFYSNGSQYIGGFANGQANGKGEIIDASGRLIYSGDFVQGQFDGYGIYHNPEGWSYEGYFEKGLFHGEGLIRNGAVVIQGIWSEGVRNG
ncbi:MAG: hypothetical protein FWG88_03250 [Oscillospiraceae bacterium]|nr:hypothetical protein [Oscillospiraceae bacterium]